MPVYNNGQLTMREQKHAVRSFFISSAFRVIMSILVLIGGFFYVLQISAVSTKGYVITSISRQIQDLEVENRSLEVKVAEYRAIENIESRLARANFVAVDGVEYLSGFGHTVARR
jgi:hypothetical protein